MYRNTIRIFCLVLFLTSLTARQCYSINNTINYNHELRVNGTCLPCPYKCKQCISATDCGANNCQNGYYYDGKTCQSCINNCLVCNNSDICLQCQPGYYISQGKCQSCHVGAATCSMSASLSCQSGFFFNNQTLFCQKCLNGCSQCQNSITCQKCVDGSILNSNNCESCSTNCVSCISGANCTKCSKGYQLVDAKCVKYQCLDGCKECSNTTCMMCESGFYLKNGKCQVGSSSLCAQSVGPDFGSCVSCVSWAYMPQDSVTYCIPRLSANNMTMLLTAVNNFEHFGQTIEICEQITSKFVQQFLLNLTIKPSYEAIINFLMLFNATNNTTLSIQQQQTTTNKSISIKNAICQDILPIEHLVSLTEPTILMKLYSSSNFSISEIVIRLKLCQAANCIACSSSTKCTKCQPPYLLMRNQCAMVCQTGYYTDRLNGKCVYSCQDGMYLELRSYECLECVSPCQTCSAATICKTCVDKYYLNDGVCVTTCPSNKTYASAGYCLRCKSPCLTCSIAGDNCTSCMVGFLFAGKCVSECPEGTFSNFTSIVQCSQCSGCQSCQMSASNCIGCNSTTFLNGNKCQVVCPSGYCGDLTLRKCLMCDQPCSQCQNLRWNCTACAVGYLSNGFCLGSCPVGYYSDNMICRLCPEGCSSCSNATCCQLCQDVKNQSYYLEGCSCRTVCQAGFASNNKCQKCLFPCATCRNTSGSNCTSCLDNLYLHQSGCVTLCPQGFYASANVCLACNKSCTVCLNNQTCSECLTVEKLENATDSDLIVLKNGKCLNKTGCSSSQYVWKNITSGQWMCRQCDLSCSKCFEWASKCLACTGSLVYLQQKYACLTNCPEGYYASNMMCKKCDGTCRLCVNDSTKCTACPMSLFLLNNTCLVGCPAGMYGDQMQSVCQSCPKQCKTCTSNTSCNSCQPVFSVPYYLYNSVCLTTCPIGTIRHPTDSICDSCGIGCASCTNLKDNCTTCKWNLYRFFNKTYSCLEFCPSGYYIDRISLQCQICKSPCQTCLNLTACLSCAVEINQTYLYRQTCVLTCPFGTYASGLICQNCSYPCKSCTDTMCLSCVNGLFHLKDQCVETCPDKMYGINNTCLNCSSPCVNCLTTTVCLSCIDGYFLKNGVCAKICLAGSYSDSRLGRCVPCSQNCKECQNSSTTCILCRGSLKLNFDTMSCDQQCPMWTYPETNSKFSLECLNCSVLCGNCSTFSKCTSCRGNLLLQKDECVSQCSDNFYSNDGRCLSCSTGCLTCNSTSCQKCVIGYLFQGMCLQSCPEQYYQNHMDNTCSRCSTGCKECISSLQCVACNSQYGLVQWGCVRLPCSFYSRQTTKGTICVNQCSVAELVSFEEKMCYESCPAHLIRRENQCLSKCPQNEFVNSGKQCSRCSSQCADLPKFSIIPIFYPNRIEFIVIFNKVMRSMPGSTFRVTIQRRLLTSDIPFSTKTIRFTYYIQQSLVRQPIVIQSTLPFIGFFDDNGNPLQTAKQTVVVESYDFYGNEGTPAIGILVCIIVIMAYIASVYFKISHLLWNTIEYCQAFFIFALLHQQYPTSLGSFFQSFMIVHWRFLPTLTYDTSIMSASPSKFHQLTTDINFLRNAGYDIIIFIILCVIVLVSWIIKRYGDRLPKVKHYASIVMENKRQILFQFFLFTVMNVILFAAIQLSDKQNKDSVVGFSYFMAILSLIVILLVSSCIIIQLYVSLIDKKMQSQRLVADMNMERNPIGLLLNGYKVARRLLLGLLLAAFPYEPMYLLSVAVVFNTVILLTVYLYKPYVEEKRNKIEMAQEGINIGVYVLLFIFILNGEASIGGKIAQGVIIQIVCCSLVAVSLIIPCEKVYKMLRKVQEKAENNEVMDDSAKLQIPPVEPIKPPVRHFLDDESQHEQQPKKIKKMNNLRTFDASSSSS